MDAAACCTAASLATAGHRLRPGSIVVLHDAHFHRPWTDPTPTIEAVDQILANATGRYEFVTAPELFRRGGRRRVHSFWRPDTDPFAARTAH